jgi:putative membrane protein
MDSRQLTTVLVVIVGMIVLLSILGMSMSGFGMMGPGMMGPGMMGRGGWGGPGGFGLPTLLLVGGIALIVLAFTRKERSPEEPLEILKSRLAKGEITREQYEDLRQVLA